jgi:HAD superfamily hydrolase (TIGR01459 family)
MPSCPTLYPSLSAIPNKYPGILLDAYGVFWGGNKCGALPGAKKVMEQLVASGHIVGILSNTTQLASSEVDKLKDPKHGIIQGTHYHFLLTSGEIARQALLKNKLNFKKYFVFCKGHPTFNNYNSIFQDTPYQETIHLEEADFAYVAVPHIHGKDQTDPALFKDHLRGLKEKNLPLLCANPDRFAHEGDPPKAVVRQGSIAKLYEEMGGLVIYFGKPYSAVYEVAFQQFSHYNIKKFLMVGDTPETDILGARRFGIDTALVTETGIMGDRVALKSFLECIQELSELEVPTYYIKRL